MVSIRRVSPKNLCIYFFICFLCIVPHFSLAAETTVSSELERLATAVKNSSGVKKHALLVEMAHLYEVAGNLEAAISSWTDAAFIESQRDDYSLLEAARCLVALGDTDKAYADVHTVLLTGRDPKALSYARYLGAQIGIFRGEENAEEVLASFIDDPEYIDRRSASLYLLYLASSKETYRSQLLSDHPLSPEAYAVQSQGGISNSQVSLSRSSLWLFFPLRGAIPSIDSGSLEKQPEIISKDNQREPTAELGINEKASALQIGLFRRLENARELVKRLENKGFKAEILNRLVEKVQYWVVTIPIGNAREVELILRLKDAGFESFPIFP